MKTFSYTITDPVGIHARPAGLLVKAVKPFESTCKIIKGEKTVDMRKLMALMGMGVKCGDTVEVSIEGPDEDAAAETIEKFFKENF
jgi:phosphocarrier protein